MRDAWRLAIGTLTAVPVRPPDRVDRATARDAMLLAPVAVLPLALLVGGIGAGGRWLGLSPLLIAMLIVGALAAGNRALHLDGLSDTVDGLAASFDPERSLAVMRSGTAGPAGVVAIVVVLGAQVAALAVLVTSVRGIVLAAVAVCGSRVVLSLCCVRGLRAARSDGLGAIHAESVPPALAGLLWLAVGVVLTAVARWSGMAWWRGPLAVVVAGIVVAVLLRRARRRFGGVTGDVFGAAVELALAALWIGLR